MPISHAAVSLALTARLAVGLRGPAPTYPPPVGMGHPDLIVGGIGDSGATAVIRGLESLGLKWCHWHDTNDEPTYAHQGRYESIKAFLKNGNRTMNREAYMKSSKEWTEAVEHQKNIAEQEAWCVLKGTGLYVPRNYELEVEKNKPWGYMEPHYSWLMPVLDEAFSNQTKYLLVARDPRDVCNSTIATDQFEHYGKSFGEDSCYTWWAKYWDEILKQYSNSDRVKIVRIEDIAVNSSQLDEASLSVVHCIAKQAGLDKANTTSSPLTTSPIRRQTAGLELLKRVDDTANRTKVWEQLAKFQEGVRAKMPKRMHIAEENRPAMVQSTAERLDLYMTMKKLGYSPGRYALVNPLSNLVCK